MNSIFITKTGKILKIDNFNENKKDEVLDTLIYNLSSPIHIEEGIKFKTFFSLIMQDKEFYDKVFFEDMRGRSLNDYEEDWKKRAPRIKKTDIGEIKYLEVSKIAQSSNFERGDVFESLTLFQGVGLDEIDNYIEYSMELMNLNEIKNYELCVNNNIEIYYNDSIDNLDKKPEPILKALTQITVYEVIQSILHEMAFHGPPEEKEKVKKELIDSQTEENIVPGLEIRIEEAVAVEDYKTAAKLKKLIEKIKKINTNKKN